MRKLILVRHSLPEISRGLPPDQWHLSEHGRELCKILAARIATLGPDLIISSKQPKALETAQMIADFLDKRLKTADGLHEVDWRANVGFLEREKYKRTIANLFQNPQQLVFGRESADKAHRRFSEAIKHLVRAYSGNLVVVAHEIVIALFVAKSVGADPLSIWRRLATSSFVVLSLPKLDLLTMTEDVTAQRENRKSSNPSFRP